jgi:hypothetical protein
VSDQLHALAVLPLVKYPLYTWISRGEVDPKADLDTVEKSLSPLPGIELRFLNRQTCRLVIIQVELLLYLYLFRRNYCIFNDLLNS